MGRILFYLLWPLIWVYSPLQKRARVYLIVGSEVLLVRNWFGDGSWQLPGGGMKFNEKIEVAAARELHEETGIKINTEKFERIDDEPYTYSRSGLIFREWILIYRMKERPDVKISSELTEYKWCDINSSDIPEIVRRVVPQA
jgi:8-oxo-dGTP pyrophosphatase MutT (NUDIX family)